MKTILIFNGDEDNNNRDLCLDAEKFFLALYNFRDYLIEKRNQEGLSLEDFLVYEKILKEFNDTLSERGVDLENYG